MHMAWRTMVSAMTYVGLRALNMTIGRLRSEGSVECLLELAIGTAYVMSPSFEYHNVLFCESNSSCLREQFTQDGLEGSPTNKKSGLLFVYCPHCPLSLFRGLPRIDLLSNHHHTRRVKTNLLPYTNFSYTNCISDKWKRQEVMLCR